jgi:hypothetical protein
LTDILNNVLASVTEVRGRVESDVRAIQEQQENTDSKLAEMDNRLCVLEDIIQAVVNKDE